jgi:DNA-binding GntR family transcriptional regulator
MAQPAGSDTSKEKVYRVLRRAIIMGHLRPNQRLTVQDLASQYGISITPIRDALQMLGQDGLVTIRPRSGYFVTFITLKELRNILELREILEVAAIERAAARITEAELDELAHVHAGYTGDDDESYDRYTDENRRFHQLIGEASGNHALAMELARVHDRLARFMVMRHAGQSQESTHALILAALRAHDVPAARAAMLDEINETRDRLLERLMQEEGDYWRLGTHS